MEKTERDITSNLLEWPSPKRPEVTTVGKDVEKSPCALLVGMQIGPSTKRSSMEVPQKIKKRNHHIIWQFTLEYISKGNTITISKRYLHLHVHYSIINSSQNVETT